MKKLSAFLLMMLLALNVVAQNRLRNKIYILDCTKSMEGYNGSPDIWQQTKDYLREDIEEEANSNPDTRITIVPFQGSTLHTINIDPKNISWNQHESVLNSYMSNITGTNICDAWLEAEKLIDPTRENYIFLLTDGNDNINGPNRLASILKAFCEKNKNTLGFYIELTNAAQLPQIVRDAIDQCDRLSVIKGHVKIGGVIEDEIHVNTRDLPQDVTFEFSNAGRFNARAEYADNDFVEVSLVDNIIDKGNLVYRITPQKQFANNISALNKAMNSDEVVIPIELVTDEITVVNPRVYLHLHNKPLRSLDIDTTLTAVVNRTEPFLWIKGNQVDTVRWVLNPIFNKPAMSDKSQIEYHVAVTDKLPQESIMLFNGHEIPDSSIIIAPGNENILELIVPQGTPNGKSFIKLIPISKSNLDRVNGQVPSYEDYIHLQGEYSSSWSWLEWLFWILIALIVLLLFVWFGFIRNSKYPKFKKGRITVTAPYYGTIPVRGYRKIILGSRSGKQSGLDKIFKGKILYHVNPAWPSEIVITPGSKRSMRYSSPDGRLISDPMPTWMTGESYRILDTADGNRKIIEIQIS